MKLFWSRIKIRGMGTSRCLAGWPGVFVLNPNRGEECGHLPSKIINELWGCVNAALAKGLAWGGGRRL